MLIKSCYIENFGRLQNKTFNFTQGLNIIKENNGWGKTTLAVFIKSMFYSMEYSRKTKILQELQKYKPWQGEKYGGNLIFEVDGKEYKIIRYFEKNKDVFTLYDMSTNKESEDYSNNIGEEIFGIDADSFERSIFISLTSEEPKMSDSINAKLNNLIHNTNDINNFDMAKTYLEKEKKTIKTSQKNSGLLGKINKNQSKVLSNLRECDNASIEIENITKNLLEVKEKRKTIEKELKANKEEINNIAKLAKRDQYNKLKKNKEEKQKIVNEIKKSFNGKVPQRDDIYEFNDKAISIQPLFTELEERQGIENKKRKLEEKVRFFDGNIPSEEEINDCSDSLNKYEKVLLKIESYRPTNEERNLYNELHQKYRGMDLESYSFEDLMNNYNEVNILKTNIENETSQIEDLKEREDLEQSKETIDLTKILYYTGGIFALIGIVFLFTPAVFFAIFSIIAALILIGFAYMIGKKENENEEISISEIIVEKEEKLAKLKSNMRILEKTYIDFIEEIDPYADKSNIVKLLSDLRAEIFKYREMKNRIQIFYDEEKKLKEEGDKIKDKVDDLLSSYRIKTGSSIDDSKLIVIIRQYKNEYTDLKREIDEYKRIKERIDLLEKDLKVFVDKYNNHIVYSNIYKTKYIDYPKTIEKIKDDYKVYKDNNDLIMQLSNEIDEFIKDNDIKSFEDIKETNKTLDELTSKQQELEREKEKSIKLHTSYNKKIDELSFIEEKRYEYEKESENLKQEEEYYTAKYKHLENTIKYLEKAKENLSIRYLKPMTKAFNGYLDMIDGGNVNISIDTDLNLQVVNKGKHYRYEHLSKGYRDIVNICTRLALAKAMFTKEKPFLILDDPFVNLDEEKLENAVSIIKEIAKENQIIFFTCRETIEK